MKIGTLQFDIYGNLNFEGSVEAFISSMDPVLSSVSSDFDSQYKRFGFIATTIQILVNLDIFWKNDSIYNKTIQYLDKNFDFWRLKLTLKIHEKGV